jgi:hypothetical protein
MFTKKYTFSLLTVLLSVLFASCSDDYDESEFNTAYDTLLTRYTSIDSLSQKLHVSPQKLVGSRFGSYKADKSLLKTLNKLNKAYAEDDMDEVEDIYDDASDYEFIQCDYHISKSEYEALVLARNENFTNELPSIAEEHFATLLNKSLEDKYSIWSMFKNILSYLFDSKEEIAKANAELITSIVNNKTVKAFYLARTKAYESLLTTEKKELFNIVADYNSFSDLSLEEIEVNVLSSTQDLMYDRLELDFEDFANQIFWSRIAALVTWIIGTVIAKNKANKAYRKELENFDAGYVPGDGIIKNGIRMVSKYFMTEEKAKAKREEIKNKYKRKARWWSFYIFLIELVVCYFVIIRPEIKAEEEIQTQIVGEYHNAIQNIDIPILEFYNKITLLS